MTSIPLLAESLPRPPVLSPLLPFLTTPQLHLISFQRVWATAIKSRMRGAREIQEKAAATPLTVQRKGRKGHEAAEHAHPALGTAWMLVSLAV